MSKFTLDIFDYGALFYANETIGLSTYPYPSFTLSELV